MIIRGSLRKRGRPGTGGGFIPSKAFPANWSSFDLDFLNDQYSGGTLPDTGNADNGQLLRGQVAPTQPNFLEQADGSLKTYTQTLATPRRSNLFGIYCGIDFTNVVIQNRTFTNAAWTLAGGTVLKNATGRTGAANSCCEVTLTATTCTVTATAAVTSAAADRIGALEWKQSQGSGGTCAISLDNGSTTPAQTSKAIAGTGARSFNKLRFNAVQTALANPQMKITLTGSIGDKFILDFAEALDGGTNAADIALYEQPPIATTTAAVKVWRDRPAAAVAGYTGTTVSSPIATFMVNNAVQVHYYEFWFRREGAIIASDAGLQVSISLTTGCTAWGMQTYTGGVGQLPVQTTDLRSPILNKLLIGRKGSESFISLNGGFVTGAGASAATPSTTHNDYDTNGAADLRNCGGMFRNIIGTDYDHLRAVAPQYTT